MCLQDPHIIDEESTCEGHQHKSSHRHDGSGEKTNAVISFADRLPEMQHRAFVLLDQQMISQRTQVQYDHHNNDRGQARYHKECGIPSPFIGQQYPYRYSKYLASRKRHLHKAQHTSTLREWKHIRDDRHRNRAHHSSKYSCDDARDEKQEITVSQSTE